MSSSYLSGVKEQATIFEAELIEDVEREVYGKILVIVEYFHTLTIWPWLRIKYIWSKHQTQWSQLRGH